MSKAISTENYDFSGWATRANLLCSDGAIISSDAFKHNDNKIVPLVWNHDYDGVDNVLGQALLKHSKDGIYAYCSFNDSEEGNAAKIRVQHKDITQMSICATELKRDGALVTDGDIKEVSLVVAGANPGASIQSVMKHGEFSSDEARIFTDEVLELKHSDNSNAKKDDDNKPKDKKDGETVGDVYNTLSDKQKIAVASIVNDSVEQALKDYKEGKKEGNDNGNNKDDKKDGDNNNDDKNKKKDGGGNNTMKHNVFDKDNKNNNNDAVLTHSDQAKIIELAKEPGVGSLQQAIKIYTDQNDTLKHSFTPETIGELFPDYKDVKPGAPDVISYDQTWVSAVMQKTHKSPISRIRTRQVDSRVEEFRAGGYKKKGDKKKETGNVKLLKRTTDPQTVYIKDKLERDDIIDITDFDVAAYQYDLLKQALFTELARAILIGDGRDDGDDQKISEEHIRSVWKDDDIYTIHTDIDIAAAKKELQGTNTSAYFGDNYVYAEAVLQSALYAREEYRGSGSPDFYCTPHLLNVMLLARDMNGRRIYDSKQDLEKALNVANIYTVEQFAEQERTDSKQKKHKLLGIMVNLSDYQCGSTKGGEITKFEDFDIDFNQYKYLIETRLSGALIRPYSAIAFEEPVSGE